MFRTVAAFILAAILTALAISAYNSVANSTEKYNAMIKRMV